MNKLLPLIAFSILLLVPVGAQQVFANHPPIPTCPPPGFLISDPSVTAMLFTLQTPVCAHSLFRITTSAPNCPAPYQSDVLEDFLGFGPIARACVALPQLAPDPTLAAQCQGAAVLLNNHCFAQVLNSMIGGAILDIDTASLLVAAIGTNPVITGLVAVTLAGVAGQAAWFIHRRKKKNSS